MFDVFYSGTKPNVFPHEQLAIDIDHARTLSRTRYFWWINYLSDYSGFDFLWEPVPWQSNQCHAWASQWQKDSGTYLMPTAGFTDTTHHADPVITRLENYEGWITPDGIGNWDYSWHPDPTDPPLIYQFGTQWQKTGGPCYLVPGAEKIKYIANPRANKTLVDSYWTVPNGMNLDSFDWTWHPDATDPPYIYQFGTQHQRTGGPVYTVPGATDTKFVDQIRIQSQRVAAAIYEIDHMDDNAGQISGVSKTVRYFDNYFDVLKRIAKNSQEEFIWICSSICDYSNFDFSWHPEQWQAGMLHVFKSNNEKFGDTFFMHVPTFQYRADRCALLEWYDLNFVDQSVPRRPLPVIKHNNDTHVNIIQTQNWAGPLALFSTNDTQETTVTVPLWREKTKTVVPLDNAAETLIVPRSAISYVKKQVYDYPYIDRSYKKSTVSRLQDIVFISYDEPDADNNWKLLSNKFSQAKRVHGVSGMELAKAAAADVSTTPWFFAVFAKTKLHEEFDFTFAPDRMQQPKHYIFHAKNTVNDLEYGHMGIVLYNVAGIRQINAQGNFGIDYTLSFAHETVPELSCYGSFDQSPYHTWRTAFRECAKLAYFESITPTVEGAYRLNIWTSRAHGPYANWCIQGANDGVEFFKSTNQQLEILKQSFHWQWLRNYFVTRYGELD